mmetsp:Transcript_119051/g.342079  ORF Transcript_119051/g.342079 Transcript_119051/m.342079 type:complete len:261 (-) Transcript_119051:752-1534(-)
MHLGSRGAVLRAVCEALLGEGPRLRQQRHRTLRWPLQRRHLVVAGGTRDVFFLDVAQGPHARDGAVDEAPEGEDVRARRGEGAQFEQHLRRRPPEREAAGDGDAAGEQGAEPEVHQLRPQAVAAAFDQNVAALYVPVDDHRSQTVQVPQGATRVVEDPATVKWRQCFGLLHQDCGERRAADEFEHEHQVRGILVDASTIEEDDVGVPKPAEHPDLRDHGAVGLQLRGALRQPGRLHADLGAVVGRHHCNAKTAEAEHVVL